MKIEDVRAGGIARGTVGGGPRSRRHQPLRPRRLRRWSFRAGTERTSTPGCGRARLSAVRCRPRSVPSRHGRSGWRRGTRRWPSRAQGEAPTPPPSISTPHRRPAARRAPAIRAAACNCPARRANRFESVRRLDELGSLRDRAREPLGPTNDLIGATERGQCLARHRAVVDEPVGQLEVRPRHPLVRLVQKQVDRGVAGRPGSYPRLLRNSGPRCLAPSAFSSVAPTPPFERPLRTLNVEVTFKSRDQVAPPAPLMRFGLNPYQFPISTNREGQY